MEVILSTAFGVQGETQTVEKDPITEKAKKALAPNPISALMSMRPVSDIVLLPCRTQLIELNSTLARRLKSSRATALPNSVHKLLIH